MARLGDVVQQRREAHRARARELVGERLGEQVGRAVAEELAVVLERRDGVEHLERVLEHVGVVVLVLPHAAQGGQLRQHGPGQPVRIHQRQPAAGFGGGHDPLELAEHALGRHLVEPRGVRGGRARRGRVELEAELDGEADRAQGAQRVVGERGGRGHANAARLEVGAAAMRVEQLAALQRLGHRVDREVAPREVGSDVALAQRHEVDVPRVSGADHPPGAERAGELERRAAGGARDRPGRGARIPVEGDVDVVGRPLEQAVADRAADQPRRAAGERRARGRERLGHAYSRGTRAEMPHVIS